jgi:hypothetical protein
MAAPWNYNNTVSKFHPYRGSHPVQEWMGFTLRQEQIAYLELLVDHGLDPITACYQLGHKPSLVLTWRRDKEVDFKAAEAVAREMQAAHEVADSKRALHEAKTEIRGLTGEDIKKSAAVANLARSLADHHKWMAAKLDSERFGERTKVENTHHIEAVVLLPPLLPTVQATAQLVAPEPAAPILPPAEAEVVHAE